MNSIKESMDLDVTFGPLAQFMRDDTVEEIWITLNCILRLALQILAQKGSISLVFEFLSNADSRNSF